MNSCRYDIDWIKIIEKWQVCSAVLKIEKILQFWDKKILDVRGTSFQRKSKRGRRWFLRLFSVLKRPQMVPWSFSDCPEIRPVLSRAFAVRKKEGGKKKEKGYKTGRRCSIRLDPIDSIAPRVIHSSNKTLRKLADRTFELSYKRGPKRVLRFVKFWRLKISRKIRDHRDLLRRSCFEKIERTLSYYVTLYTRSRACISVSVRITDADCSFRETTYTRIPLMFRCWSTIAN